MRKLFVYLVAAGALISCQREPMFCVTGEITGAEGTTLYLEHTALLKTTTMDSCVMDKDGAFSLHATAPVYPDMYRLRIGKQSLLLAVDSTEEISVTTSLDSLSTTQSIKGSEASLCIAQLRATARRGSWEQVREHAQQIIVSNPRSLAAYYAVFFKQNGQHIWDITNKSDRRMFQAVATSFNTWMPDYDRSKALYAQISDVIKAEREILQQVAVQQLIDEADNAFLDIELPDEIGNNQALSSLRGKVIVLDFSAIEMDQSREYIFELRELYNEFHTRGLEIYSVSLDRNKLLWEDGVTNLPWTNVYAGEKAIEVLSLYNVQTIPTLFLFDKSGMIQGRYTDFTTLGTDLPKYL